MNNRLQDCLSQIILLSRRQDFFIDQFTKERANRIFELIDHLPEKKERNEAFELLKTEISDYLEKKTQKCPSCKTLVESTKMDEHKSICKQHKDYISKINETRERTIIIDGFHFSEQDLEKRLENSQKDSFEFMKLNYVHDLVKKMSRKVFKIDIQIAHHKLPDGTYWTFATSLQTTRLKH